MLEYDLAHWVSFLAAAFLLNISPGPDFAFILGHTIRGGKRAGFAAMLGAWTGVFWHIGLAAVGLSAILAASATVYAAVKWAGVAYLFWMGWQALRSRGAGLGVREGREVVPLLAVFRQGLYVNLLNPKTTTFFLAFLPQFVEPGAGPVWLQLVVHGLLINVVAAMVEPVIILVGDRLTNRLRESRRLRVWLDRVLGSVLIGLGVELAVSEG